MSEKLRLMGNDWVNITAGSTTVAGKVVVQYPDGSADLKYIPAVSRGAVVDNWERKDLSGIPMGETIIVEWFGGRESGGCYLMDRPEWGHFHIEFDSKKWRICYGVTVICSGRFVHEFQRAALVLTGEPLTRKEQ